MQVSRKGLNHHQALLHQGGQDERPVEVIPDVLCSELPPRPPHRLQHDALDDGTQRAGAACVRSGNRPHRRHPPSGGGEELPPPRRQQDQRKQQAQAGVRGWCHIRGCHDAGDCHCERTRRLPSVHCRPGRGWRRHRTGAQDAEALGAHGSGPGRRSRGRSRRWVRNQDPRLRQQFDARGVGRGRHDDARLRPGVGCGARGSCVHRHVYRRGSRLPASGELSAELVFRPPPCARPATLRPARHVRACQVSP